MSDLARVEILDEVACAHGAAPWRAKGAVIDRAAERLGVSRQTVFRWLEEAGYTPGADRKRRADSGTSRKLDPDALTMVAGMLAVGSRANGKQVLTLDRAVKLACANHLIPQPVATTTVARQLRARGMHPRQLAAPTPHVNLQSLHPNHVWQIDASVCVLFYLEDGGVTIMEEKKFNRNKPQHLARIEKQRVIRYVVTDHYSGALYLEYRLGAESQENLTEVFLNAITLKEGEPFHGVPFILMMDKGSANTSHGFLNLLRRLQVTPITHQAGNPRAKGQVEASHQLVELGFEGGRFRMHDCRDLAELNQLARQWRIACNAREIHSRHGSTRYGLWLTITEQQLRIAPPRAQCRELVTTKDRPIKVRGDLTIRYSVKGHGPQRYDVRHLPGVLVGGEVVVRASPYHAPLVDAVTTDAEGREHLIPLEPLAITAAGFVASAAVIGEEYKSAPDTLADTARKRLLELAYSAANQEEAQRVAKSTPAFAGVIDPFADIKQAGMEQLAWFPRPGTALLPPVPTREPGVLELVKAALRLRELLGRNLAPVEFADLRERYPAGIPEESLADLARELEQPTTIIPFRRVAGAAC